MPSVISHAFVASSLGAACFARADRRRVVLVAAACSALPDLDVLGFRLGIAYGDLLGHRGLSHSLPFAAALAPLVALTFFRERRWRPLRPRLIALLFVATASHGLLDAMTTGGLGVAFFSPFDPTRYFLPFRPILVSPFGISGFLSLRGVHILANELLWLWLPTALLATILGTTLFRTTHARPDPSALTQPGE